MSLLGGSAGRRALVVLTVAWAVSCSSNKKTLLLVNVKLGVGVSPPTSVSLAVSAAGTPLGSTEFSWSRAKQDVLQAGIFLPAGVTGTVRADADGTGPFGAKTAGSTGDRVIVAGITNGPFDLILLTASGGFADAGTPEAGAPPTEADALGPDLANSDLPNADATRVLPDAGVAEVGASDANSAEVLPPTPDGGAVEVVAGDASVAEAALVVPDDAGHGDSPVDAAVPKFDRPPADASEIDAPSGEDAASDSADAEPDTD